MFILAPMLFRLISFIILSFLFLSGVAQKKNIPGTTEYVSRIAAGLDVVAGVRTLSAQTRAEEALFTGIRLSKGVSLADIQARYGIDAWDEYGTALAPFVEAGVVQYTPPVLALTRQGMLLANEVCAVFV